MRRMRFVSRHTPTAEQVEMAAERGYELVHTGDVDAFDMEAIQAVVADELSVTPAGDIPNFAVVNPALALNILSAVNNARIGVFENGQRSVEGGKPTFYAKSLHIWANPMGVVRL